MSALETPSRGPALDDPLPAHYARNVGMLVADSAIFTLAMSFVGPNTVLPALLVRLSASEVVVGLAAGLISGAWLLPQLLVASAMARVRRLVPTMAISAWLSRPLFLVMGLVVALTGDTNPALTVAVLIGGFTLWSALDAVVSVPWFQFVGRALPPRRRGRVLGFAQSLGALGGIGAGIAVRFILGQDSPWSFPSNYAILFAIAGSGFLAAALALTLLREPPSTLRDQDVPSLREVLALLPRILLDDQPFRRLVQVRLVAGFVSMASAFYILYATRKLGLGIEAAGLFVSAQVFGSLLAGLVTSFVQDHLGPLAHMRVMITLSVMAPLLALASGPLATVLGPAVLYPYLLRLFLPRDVYLLAHLALPQLDPRICGRGAPARVHRHDQHPGRAHHVGPRHRGLARQAGLLSRRFRHGHLFRSGCVGPFAASPRYAQDGPATRPPEPRRVDEQSLAERHVQRQPLGQVGRGVGQLIDRFPGPSPCR